MSRKRNIPTIINQKEVTEDLIRIAALMTGKDSSFYEALALGEEYRQAGLKPVYIMDSDKRQIYVTTAERLANKYDS